MNPCVLQSTARCSNVASVPNRVNFKLNAPVQKTFTSMFHLNLATNHQTWKLQSSGTWCRIFWGTGDDVSHYNWRNPRKTRGSLRGPGRILSFDFTTFLRADSIGLPISSRFRLRPQATVVCPRTVQVLTKFSKYEVAPHQLNLSRTCCKVLYGWLLISFPNIYTFFSIKNGIQKYLKPCLQALQNIISSVAITKHFGYGDKSRDSIESAGLHHSS